MGKTLRGMTVKLRCDPDMGSKLKTSGPLSIRKHVPRGASRKLFLASVLYSFPLRTLPPDKPSLGYIRIGRVVHGRKPGKLRKPWYAYLSGHRRAFYDEA